jgi:hypothetical protein
MCARTWSGSVAVLAVLLAGCSSSHDSAGIASVSTVYASTVVVFQRPDGTVQESVTLDAPGTASARIVPGSFVTVARYYPGASSGTIKWHLTTIAGIQPGDALQMDAPPATQIAAGTVLYPGACAGASQYSVDIGCTWSTPASNTGPVSLSILEPTCGSTVDVLGVAWNGWPGGVATAYATAYAVPVSAGSASADLGPWQPAGSTSITVTNLPADVSGILVTLDAKRNGVLFDRTGSHASVTVTGPTPSITLPLPYPVDFATSARRWIRGLFPGGTLDTVELIANDASYAPATVDLSTLPQRLSSLQVASTGGRVLATWDQAGIDSGLVGTVLVAWWIGSDGMRYWETLLPPGATSFSFPRLPEDLAVFEPDGIASRAFVRTWGASDVASYTELKRRLAGSPQMLPEAGNGTVRSSWTQAQTPAPP